MEITCINCPVGCRLSVELEDGKVISVSGNTCKRGDTYARAECTNPVRSLTTTVRVNGGIYNVVPCKSEGSLPKDKIFDCMEIINKTQADAPVSLGDILVENILGTGINIVATNHCPAK